METSQLLRKKGHSRGFSLLEVLIAVVVLAIGILGAAALMSQMNTNSSGSRYMSTEALLASEKLEDLNRYAASSGFVAPGGSLTADVATYSDQVQMSSGVGNSNSGSNSNDLVENFAANGSYAQIVHSPSGQVSSQTIVGTPADPTSDMLVFNRRWLIEANTPIPGVRRITVWVNMPNVLNGVSGEPRAPFQLTMVRP